MWKRLAFFALVVPACPLALLVACGEDTPPAAADAGDAAIRVRVSDARPDNAPAEPEVDAARPPCLAGGQDSIDRRCDPFDDGEPDPAARGWTVLTAADAAAPVIEEGTDPPTAPNVLAATTPASDAGYQRSVLTDSVTASKPISVLEADVFVAEWSGGDYRILHMDFGPAVVADTQVTLEVSQGKWRCNGYLSKSFSNEILTLNTWHHVVVSIAEVGTNLRMGCQVDGKSTTDTPAPLSPGKTRVIEVGTTTYANASRTRILFDNVSFHSD